MRNNAPSSPWRSNATRLLLIAAGAALGGCDLLATQLQHKASPDRRITVGWQDRLQLRSREIGRYKCEDGYFLRCDGPGTVTLSCTCSLE